MESFLLMHMDILSFHYSPFRSLRRDAVITEWLVFDRMNNQGHSYISVGAKSLNSPPGHENVTPLLLLPLLLLQQIAVS